MWLAMNKHKNIRVYLRLYSLHLTWNSLMSQLLKIFIVLLLTANFAFASETEQKSASLRDIWASLDNTTNQCPELYDYFPNGGMRIFYCHVKNRMNYAQLRELAGIPIYLKGPHTDYRLNLNARFEFGYYNPEFVSWLIKNALPAAQDPEFRRLTQTIYEQNIRLTAQTYYIVYKDLQANPDYLQAELAKYEKLIQKRTLPEFYGEEYYYFSGLYEKGYDGNVAQRAVLFWLRRFMDGTAKTFFAGLEQLINLYDENFALRYKCEFSQQAEQFLECAEQMYKQADEELNRVYQELKNKLDEKQQQNLLEAQRLWLTFRDSNAVFVADFYRGVRDEKVALIDAKTALTRERTAALQALSMEIH